MMNSLNISGSKTSQYSHNSSGAYVPKDICRVFFPKLELLHFTIHLFRKSAHESWNRIKNISQEFVDIKITSDFENKMILVNIMLLHIASVCFACISLRHSYKTCFILNKSSNAMLHVVILDCRQRRCSRWWSWKQRWIAGQQQWSKASASKLKLENTASLKWEQNSK